MRSTSKWQKGIFVSTLIISVACNTLTGISPSSPAPLSTTTVAASISTPSASQFKPGDPTATPLGSEITDPNFIKGVEAFNAENDAEVIELMSAVIRANPNLAPPYRYRGISYWYLGDCEAGLADEEKALSLNPNYAAAWAGRGLMHSCLGNSEQAFQDYQKALSIDPSLAFVHENMGVDYYEQGNYEKSLEEYSISAAIDPNRSGAWNGKAQAQMQMGQYDECISNATKAIEINPEEWLAYTTRGYCEEFAGENPAAILDYKAYLEHDPTDAKIWYNLGNAQHHANFPEEAIDSFSKALDLDPTYYQANINRGLAYTDLEKYDEALDDFNRALQFGDIPAAYSGRGTVYYFQGKYDEAIADLELATSMMPDRPHSYCMLAYAYFEVGRYQDSLAAALRVEEIAPGCGGQKLFEVMIQSYYAARRYEEGIAYITMTFEVRGQIYMLGYYYRGIMYDEIGKTHEAIKDLEFFLAVEQSFATIYPEQIADAKARLARLKP